MNTVAYIPSITALGNAHLTLDSLFHPKSIAVISAASDFVSAAVLGIVLEHGLEWKVYPINRSGSEVQGLKAYTSVKDVPGPVDYAFIQVPTQASVQVIKDCSAKVVKLVALATAGFSESKTRGVK